MKILICSPRLSPQVSVSPSCSSQSTWSKSNPPAWPSVNGSIRSVCTRSFSLSLLVWSSAFWRAKFLRLQRKGELFEMTAALVESLERRIICCHSFWLPLWFFFFFTIRFYRRLIDKESFLVFSIALTVSVSLACAYTQNVCIIYFLMLLFVFKLLLLQLFIMGTVAIIGSDDLLACFIAGNSFTWDDWFRKETEEAHLQEVRSSIIMIIIIILTCYY